MLRVDFKLNFRFIKIAKHFQIDIWLSLNFRIEQT